MKIKDEPTNTCSIASSEMFAGTGGGEEQKKKKKKKKKTVNRTPATSSAERKRPRLVTFEEAPEYLKDNEFILSRYRAEWPLWESLLSVFRWHNETLNIWTHLIGFVLFLWLTVANLSHLHGADDIFIGLHRSSCFVTTGTNSSGNSKDKFYDTTEHHHLKQLAPPSEKGLMRRDTLHTAARWPFYVYLGGATFCLLSSCLCHLFLSHSHRLNLILLRVDYVGITVMIVNSFFPTIFYLFQCHPHWQITYLVGVTGLGAVTVAMLFSPVNSSPERRPFRAMLFLALGLFAVVPLVHAVAINWNKPRCLSTVVFEAAMAVAYIVGTVFYVCRVPERWRPGLFDLVGHSHQIFHVFIIVGALAHYAAALTFIEWRDAVGCQ